MQFKRHLKIQEGLNTFHIAPAINIVLLLLLFYILTSILTSPSSINVRLPKAITSNIIKEETAIITISGEDIVYLNNQIVNINNLDDELKSLSQKNKHVLIKTDRRASVGKIVEIWDLCRKLGIERINIATN